MFYLSSVFICNSKTKQKPVAQFQNTILAKSISEINGYNYTIEIKNICSR